MSATIPGPDGQPRCRWCAAASEFLHYHDREWIFPSTMTTAYSKSLAWKVFNPVLSWRTILAKRDNFRAAFVGFDFNRVARF